MLNLDKGLKWFEGSMGNNIKESSVPFDIDRKLTEAEIAETVKYCVHDVEQTIDVFLQRKEEFNGRMGLVKLACKGRPLDLSLISKTKPQLTAIILDAHRQGDRDDEFDIDFPTTHAVKKYQEVLDWYMNPDNRCYYRHIPGKKQPEKNQFNDLGLLIIDEEQKFGVKQKEKLREMRLSVDSLSMSATPIPRSLHLSMTGVRDISLINTPPINRLPVETKLMKRDDEVLKNAILDELARGGQVFIVNDRVQSIYSLADDIEAMVPHATIGVAHGQMNDRDLENAMDSFLSRKFDILISTSIIESGLDVPNANTIIIMNAHHFGISQLYQMRGRVGRSSVLAKAFLVIPAKHDISPESMRRLQALEQFTDLGSGYQLAMRDLEIRGAGNLLGQEQHGFIAEVGFETYVRLVKEAVEMLRGGPSEKPIQTSVEIGVDAYLPEDYIEDGLTRISMYQRIARVSHTDEIQGLAQELEDRFGPVPEAAKMLLLVTEIGLLAGRLRIQGLVQRKGLLAATFAEFPPPEPRVISEMYGATQFPMRIMGGSPLQVVIELGKGTNKELAERALKEFRAFATIKAQAATIQPKNPLLAGIGEAQK